MDSRRSHLAEKQEEYSCIHPTEWQPFGTYQYIARKRKERGDGTDKTMAKINDNLTAYLLVNNLTNECYETKAVAKEGIGALPMEGRNFMIGLNYTF